MPKIEQSVLIDAPIETVFAVARDVEKFPQFMADLKSLTVLERNEDNTRTVTEWVGLLREFKMTIKWTQEDRWDTEQYRDDYSLIKGDMDQMEGYWQFSSEAARKTRFDSVLDYEYDVPLIGPMVKNLIKKKLTDNLQATLNAIKGEAEKQAGSE